MELLIGLTVPMAGTALGAALVFLIRDRISQITNNAMLGFASGIMVAASFWSLLQPALEQTGDGLANNWPVIVGFIAGMGFLLLLDTIIPHQHSDNEAPEGPKSSLSRSTKMILAVGLHNIPVGMAVGVVLSGVMGGNFPEGAIISIPLHGEGKSKPKAFLLGALSGLVEPLAAVATILFLSDSAGAMPPLLAFAAGAMLYVVVEELIPSSQQGKHSNIGTLCFAVGFVLMMLLDAVLHSVKPHT